MLMWAVLLCSSDVTMSIMGGNVYIRDKPGLHGLRHKVGLYGLR